MEQKQAKCQTQANQQMKVRGMQQATRATIIVQEMNHDHQN